MASNTNTDSIGGGVDELGVCMATFLVMCLAAVCVAVAWLFRHVVKVATSGIGRSRLTPHVQQPQQEPTLTDSEVVPNGEALVVSKTNLVVPVAHDVPSLTPVQPASAKDEIPESIRDRSSCEQWDHSSRSDLEFVVRTPKGEVLRARVVLWFYPGRKEVRRTLFPIAKSVVAMFGKSSVSLKTLPFPSGSRKADAEALTRAEVDAMLQPSKKTVGQPRRLGKTTTTNMVAAVQKVVEESISDLNEGYQTGGNVVVVEPPPVDFEPLPWESTTSSSQGGDEGFLGGGVEPGKLVLEKPHRAALVSYTGQLVKAGVMWNNGAKNPFKGFCVVIHDDKLDADQPHWGSDLRRAINDVGAVAGDHIKIGIIGETPSKVQNGNPKKIWDCSILGR